MRKICRLTILCFVLFCLISCANQDSVDDHVCRLPEDSIPGYSFPQAQQSDTLVFENYSEIFTWDVNDGTICSVEVSLPAMNPIAEIADEYNLSVSQYAEDILAYIDYTSQNGLAANIVSVSFETYQSDNIFSILITEKNASGDTSYQVESFDLDTKEKLTTPELTDRLLKMDYPSFLLASNILVCEDFSENYSNENIDQETYDSILGLIPVDTYNLYNRRIFQNNDGDILMLYQQVLMSEDWWYGLQSKACIAEIDLDSATWNNVDLEDAMHNLLTLRVSYRRYYPEYYSYLLQDTFMSAPETFIEQLSLLDETQSEEIIDYLFYAATDNILIPFGEICSEYLSIESLTDAERATAKRIYSFILKESE